MRREAEERERKQNAGWYLNYSAFSIGLARSLTVLPAYSERIDMGWMGMGILIPVPRCHPLSSPCYSAVQPRPEMGTTGIMIGAAVPRCQFCCNGFPPHHSESQQGNCAAGNTTRLGRIAAVATCCGSPLLNSRI